MDKDPAKTSHSFKLNRDWRKLWFVEIWIEKRQIFKELVFHTVLFTLLVAGLELGHRILELSTLADEEKYWLNKLHFYLYAIILLIFAASFIITAWKLELGGKK